MTEAFKGSRRFEDIDVVQSVFGGERTAWLLVGLGDLAEHAAYARAKIAGEDDARRARRADQIAACVRVGGGHPVSFYQGLTDSALAQYYELAKRTLEETRQGSDLRPRVTLSD